MLSVPGLDHRRVGLAVHLSCTHWARDGASKRQTRERSANSDSKDNGLDSTRRQAPAALQPVRSCALVVPPFSHCHATAKERVADGVGLGADLSGYCGQREVFDLVEVDGSAELLLAQGEGRDDDGASAEDVADRATVKAELPGDSTYVVRAQVT